MEKIAVIINHQYGQASPNIQHKLNRLKTEFDLLGYQIDVFQNDGSIAFIDNNEVKLNIHGYRLVIYLDKDKYLARLLEKAGLIVVNSAQFIELCDDKMLTHISLANKGIKMPKTIAGPLVFSSSFKTPENVLENVINEIGFPVLIKGVYGSLGQNMVLCNNKEELYNNYQKMMGQPLLFQEYVKSSYGQSIRCLVCDHRILGAFKRYNSKDYRSNFHEGASSMVFDLPNSYRIMCEKIIEELDIDYAGIDLLIGEENEPILCEINSNAFFKEFEKVTGINAAREFALMCIKKLNKI